MKNVLLNGTAKSGKEFWIACPREVACFLRGEGIEMTVYEQNKVDLQDLPAGVIKDVMETLTAYNSCHVTFYGGEFHAAAGFGIMASYPIDWFVVGDYYAEEVYTKEERWAHERALSNAVIY